MNTSRRRMRPYLGTHSLYMLSILILCAGVLLAFSPEILAQVSLPGSDPSSRMEAAGSLLKLVDTVVFTWMARLLAGLCVLSSGWSLKEQRFGVAIICLLAAVVIGTAPAWVKNIFAAGGGGVLSTTQIQGHPYA